MSPEGFYWLTSTIEQTFAALAAITVVVTLFAIERLERRVEEARLTALSEQHIGTELKKVALDEHSAKEIYNLIVTTLKDLFETQYEDADKNNDWAARERAASKSGNLDRVAGRLGRPIRQRDIAWEPAKRSLLASVLIILWSIVLMNYPDLIAPIIFPEKHCVGIGLLLPILTSAGAVNALAIFWQSISTTIQSTQQ